MSQMDNGFRTESSLLSLPHWMKIIIALAVLALLISLTANAMRQYRYIGRQDSYTNTITMTGSGKVVAVPDVMKVSLGYSVTKPTVVAAQQDAVGRINDMVTALKDMDIDAKDIRTASYYVSPEYQYNPDGRRTVTGYSVSQNLEVTIRNFDASGTILQLAADKGLNQIGSLQFTIDDREAYLQEARVAAIKNAKEKADSLAKEAGVSLGKIVSINEDSYPYQPAPYAERYDALAVGSSGAVAPDIQAGSDEINVTIYLVYEVL